MLSAIRLVNFVLSENVIATIHLIEGPVGAGKSTYAAKLSLSLGAPHLNLDEWMAMLFSQDRPQEKFVEWYRDRKARCIEQIWAVACELMDKGIDPVLELGLVQISDREALYHRVDGTRYKLRMYLLDAPVEVRRQRVRERNTQKGNTYKMEVSDEMFELANRFWQDMDARERKERNVEVILTS